MKRHPHPRPMRAAGRRRLLALAAVLAGAGPATISPLAPAALAAAQEFRVDRRAANVVRFTSRAATEEFQGVTEKIDGYVLLDGPTVSPATGSGTTEVHLEVDLASLDTGIGLRNRHMRDRYLETAKHPFATFHGRILRSEPGAGSSHRVTARGMLEIHGVARPRDLTCSVEPRGPGYRATCAFQVLLSDHRIEIPKVMFLKLANEIGLELDFSITPAPPSDGGSR